MERKVVGVEKAVVAHKYWCGNDRKVDQEWTKRICRRKRKCQNI